MTLPVTDPVALTEALCNIKSESFSEQEIADLVATSLAQVPGLEVQRLGNNLVAQTVGEQRVILAGHLDTVPAANNLPVRRDAEFLHGLGTVDMKGGIAVMLHLAHTLKNPNRGVTYIFYEAEEVAAEHNGLGKLAAAKPELLQADFAVLLEPSNAIIEAGCQGTIRAEIRTSGKRAHSARAWMGNNAIHQAAEILNRLQEYQPRKPVVDGLTYHEGLNAVLISGGVATNVIPDECVVTVNYRFAPDRSLSQAIDFLHSFFIGFAVTLVDQAAAARPGLTIPAATEFIAAFGGEVTAKFGWTDVARFSELGVPAVNYGPGDPSLAHRQDEHVPIKQIETCAASLRNWLSSDL